MPMYDRREATACVPIDRWEGGVGWLAYPDEEGQRASHAFREDGELWLFDPIDAPGVEELLAALATGEDRRNLDDSDDRTNLDEGDDATSAVDTDELAAQVASVVVCSDYHARNAETFAERYDVAVHVPSALDRSAERIDVPVQRFDDGIAGFDVRILKPLYAWHEAIAYRERDRTLYVPDSLSSTPKFTVGDERIGLPTPSRLRPPSDRFAGMTPDRVLFGHGEGIFDGADAALRDTLGNARRRLPRALLTNVPAELRAGLGAFR